MKKNVNETRYNGINSDIINDSQTSFDLQIKSEEHQNRFSLSECYSQENEKSRKSMKNNEIVS